jgi:pilin isopeptide linkage protein
LALLLALLMVFTATGMQVFANDGTDTDDTEQVEENTPVVEESQTEPTTTPEVETTTTPEVETTTTPEQTTTVETPTETTTDTTTTVDTNGDQTNETPAESTEPAEPSETTDGSAETTEDETAETPPDPLDLTSYIKKSSMNVTSGDTPYAIDGQTVAPMEFVSVTLEFGEVTGLAQGQQLVYNISQSYVQADTISESNTDKNKVLYRTSASTSEPVYGVIGTFTLDAGGKVTITPDEKYLTEDGTVELPGGQFTFTGMLSSQLEEGEQSLNFGGTSTSLAFTVAEPEEEEENEPVVSSPKRGPAKAAAATNTVDLKNYVTDDSSLTVTIDNKKYTMAELKETGRKVPEGSAVYVKLYFESVTDIPEGATLTYQIPSSLAVTATSEPTAVLDPTKNKVLGYFVVDDNGLITVTIDQSYHDQYEHKDTETLDLQEFNLFFYGSFSSSAGQDPNTDDNVIKLSGSASSNDVSFTIPFDYKNYYAHVKIEKTGTFDVSTRTIHYTVKVTAPDTNTENAYNVKVTDYITAAKSFIEKGSDGNVYQNVTPSRGSFDADSGVWTIDGNMAPGDTATLTYDLVVDKTYFTSNTTGEAVSNTAKLTYNESGTGEDTDQQAAPGTVLVEKKSANNLGSDANGDYVTYTLTATCYGNDMQGVQVNDEFSTKDMVKTIVADNVQTGTVEIDNDNKSFVWSIGDMTKDQVVTLTYKAYLDPTAWQKATTENYFSKAQTNSQTLRNTATVTVNNTPGSDGTTGDPYTTDTYTETKTVEKTWLQKTSSKNGDIVTFTVTANAAPTAMNVTSIWDKLDTTSGATYEAGGVITLKKYDSSINKKLLDTATINIADVLDENSTNSWTINLKSVKTSDNTTADFSGPYYYELTYKVNAAGVDVFENAAGLGMGTGYNGFNIIKSVQGSNGWSRDTDYDKSFKTKDYSKGETTWNIRLKKSIPAGLQFYDQVSTTWCYNYGWLWMDDDTLSRMVVKQGNTVLTLNEDYIIIPGTQDIGNATAATKSYYSGFYVEFLKDIEINNKDSSTYVTIDYVVKFTTEAYSYDNRKYTHNEGSILFANYTLVYYPSFGVLKKSSNNVEYWNGTYISFNKPLYKSNGTYTASDRTVEWTVEVNSQSTLSGEATLTDLLPEGLTLDSVQIYSMGSAASANGTTVNGQSSGTIQASDIQQEAYSEGGKNYTKITLNLANLCRCVADGATDYNSNGKITLTVKTKVDPDYLVRLEKDTTLTNTVYLTGNTGLPAGGVTDTGSVTIPASASKVMTKSQASTASPAYVQFALNINTESADLVDGDYVTIDDVMGEGMSMATAYKDPNLNSSCFAVYAVDGVSDLTDSFDNVVVSQALTGQDVTSECSWEPVSGEENTYRFTVPDGKHVVIIYWASFTGIEGQSVSLTNTANFFYNDHDYTNNESNWNASLQVQGAGASAYTNPFFYLQKQDQWGNNVSGATFEVFEYNATTKEWTSIATRTTTDGVAYIGHRADETQQSFPTLKSNTIYKIVEIKSPAGYIQDSTEHYFEFAEIGTLDANNNRTVTDDDITAHNATHPEGLTIVHLTPGGTYTVKNTFSGANLELPVKKTINGENISSTTEFSFTLTQTSGSSVYTDSNYKAKLTQGIQATIKGSGVTTFKPLFFKTGGTYKFSLVEDSLSADAISRGYTGRDENEYTVTVTVSDEGTIAVSDITFTSTKGNSGDIRDGDYPTFDNQLSLTGAVSLQVKKTVNGRSTDVQPGEFSFEVLDDGEVVKQDGKALVFQTGEKGIVDITIPVTQEDIGTKYYVIREVVPEKDQQEAGVSYDAEPIIAVVTVGEVSVDGKAAVAATSDVTYYAEETDEDGIALMVNNYKASGSITLTGSKKLTQIGTEKDVKIGEKQFTFTVKEDRTVVATGYTETNGDITFTTINYIQSDVGEHTYTITEDSYTTPFIEFDDSTFTVKVNVTDVGGGSLRADIEDSSDTVIFHNISTTLFPTTGINLDFWPYLLIFALALGCGALALRRRKHMRG